MKREVASVVASMLATTPPTTWRDLTAFNMDGSGWEQSVDDMILLLDQERYVMYDMTITTGGLDLSIWFPTVSPG